MSAVVAAPPPLPSPALRGRESPWRRAAHRFLRHRLAVFGLVVIVVFFAAAIAVNNLCVWAGELGMQQYLIRVPTLTPAVRRAALGLSLTAACLIAALLLGACALLPAGWLSAEYRQSLGVLALLLPLQSCNVVASAVLHRQLRFAPILLSTSLSPFAVQHCGKRCACPW
jgi:peptide/nickel transport system permease protein